MQNQYFGGTRYIPGATCFDTKAIITIEEGYNLGVTLEYVKIGDFKVSEVESIGEQQQRISLRAMHGLDYSANHSQLVSSEFKSTVDYKTSFTDASEVYSNWETSEGATLTDVLPGLNIIQNGAKTRRFAILGKYPDLQDLRVDATFQRTTTTASSREIWTVFRYRDETNYMFVKYALGQVILGDMNNAVETKIFTKSGVSVTANLPYYMTTVVHNNRVMHFGSTDGYTYTKHIDVNNIYGSSWGTMFNFTNSRGAVGIETFGMSDGRFAISDFRVFSLDDQITSDEAIRHIQVASGNFGVSIEKEYSNMSTMMSSPGSSWALQNNQAVRMVTSQGASWDTLMTLGSSFTDFVAECRAKGSVNGVIGMCFGETNNFWGYYSGTGNNNDGLERYNNGRVTANGLGNFVSTSINTENHYKMVKQDNKLAWFVNGTRVATAYGISSGDILSSPGRIGVFAWGQSVYGVTYVINDFSISKLDYPVDSFIIEGNEHPRNMADRFLPKGFVFNSSPEGVNVVQIGSSRGLFSINSFMKNPTINKKYSSDPSLVSVRGLLYSNNLNTGLSSTMIRTDDSYITSYNDDNIKSTKGAKSIALDIMNEENQLNYKLNIDVSAIPTLEPFDKVAISDSTHGTSSVYTVETMSKTFDSAGYFNQSLSLTKNGE